MIDEVMNAILFLLIGFEMLIVPLILHLLWLGCIAIVIVLFARFVSVSLPIMVLKRKSSFEKNAIPILTWGASWRYFCGAGIIGAQIYVWRNVCSITYIVVLFSIVVQGLTIGKFASKLAEVYPPPESSAF